MRGCALVSLLLLGERVLANEGRLGSYGCGVAVAE